jgi:uncharacterized protein
MKFDSTIRKVALTFAIPPRLSWWITPETGVPLSLPLDLQCSVMTIPGLSRLKGTMKRITPLAIPRSLLVLTILVQLAPQALRAEERASNPTPNTVWVGADGKYEAEPDTAVVQFNISAQEDNLQAANTRASKAAEQVRQLLRTNGLDPKQAQVGMFSVQPVYDYKNPKRKLVGYRVDTNISIKLKDFSKIGAITQGLADMDVTGNQSLSYVLDDMDSAKIKAVEDALHRANEEANAVARSSGRTLGELSYASVDTYEQPQPRPMPMAAPMAMKAGEAVPAPTEEFGAQKIAVTAHVNAVYNLK